MNRRNFLLGSIVLVTLTAARIKQNISGIELSHIIRATRHPTFPAGTLIASARTTLPPGWLPADGRSLDADAFPELFAVIGTTYTRKPTFLQRAFKRPTFNISDLRSRV